MYLLAIYCIPNETAVKVTRILAFHGSFQQERSEFGCRCLLLLDSCFADS